MPQNKITKFEVCVESAQGIEACIGLVDRIELCSALDIGGLTPSVGLMKTAKDHGLETQVLIRPSGGDFEMTEADLNVALADIRIVKDVGLAGVVIGATKGGQLDTDILAKMIEAADGLTLTLHRAFDVVDDQFVALDQAVDLCFDRILTSGGAKSAPFGVDRLRDLVEHSRSRIEIMAGGGVTIAEVSDLIEKTGVDAVHSSCSVQRSLPDDLRQKGFGDAERITDVATIEALRRLARA